MAVDRLIVLASSQIMGEVRRDARNRLTFVYDDAWRNSAGGYPLSLSMPLAAAIHEHARIEHWLWGLLPDNEAVLARWGQRFQVSPRNVFALLAAVGEDCAGAVQFVRPDRLDVVLNSGMDAIEWLTERDVAERLRLLRRDQSAWRMASDAGQFSLAGAQPKTALFCDAGRWGVPSGRAPTTHILKPPLGDFEGHAENEHFCLTLARTLGLPAARSQVLRFEDELAIVVERYDRVRAAGQALRLHQEDMCQALAVAPTKKYQNEGGPNPSAITDIIRAHSTKPQEDVWTFVKSLMLNWLIAGTDAHAKNYAMLIAAGGQARLAPLYDVASALPYDFDFKKLRMAMKIGGVYPLSNIGPRQWTKFAAEVRAPAKEVIDQCLALTERLPEAASAAADKVRAEGLDHLIIVRLADLWTKRAAHCRGLISPRDV